ncbi:MULTISPECIES: hypothetical protein [Nostoc]|uniref:Uncharacterized protein n=1 Tax=Nostoc paludosum FACHB-159 TaxID=2692908 RepID=A0ABR8KK33_9NOSO|nr:MULTISPECIES: hypothetical protein [Nostoc]MBD2683615.1 hypothetical protein [Nostoc sp. FACHB-857]MBD2739940.1 hypothetical protein [Nostoc paludosum FACHB-159]
MELQSTINWLLEIIVMGFTSIMAIDFVNGLFQLPYTREMAVPKLRAIAPVTTNSQALALQQEPVAAPIPEPPITPDPKEQPQLAQLPDPWELTADIQPTPIQTQPIVLGFPTLPLLPPAAQVQPKAKATRKSTAKPKSTTTTKSSKPINKAVIQKSSKSRKSAAA